MEPDMSDYPTLFEASEAVNDFQAVSGVPRSDVLVGATLVAFSINRLADELKETNRLLVIIAANTGNF
jgi:hypothetical protein